MKSIFLIALFATVIFATLSNKEVHLQLSEIQKETFGQTMLNAIQMNMNSNNSPELIRALLEQIIHQLAGDQEQADNRIEEVRSSYRENLDSLSNRITQTTNTITSLENSIKLNKVSLDDAKTQLIQAQSDYDNTVNSIDVGTKERAEANQKWKESDAELTETLASVDEATKLIQHMLNGVSFVQVKSRFDKVFDKLKNNQSKQASLFRPLVMALSQISNKLDYNNVQKILNLLNSLRQSLADVQNNNKNVEERQSKQWDEDLVLLLQHKKRYYEQILEKNTLIGNLESSISRETLSLANNRLTLDTLENELKAVKLQYNNDEEHYTKFSTERERETDILEKLNDYLAVKFGAVSEFLQIQ
ncbi:secretory granule protein t4-b, putative [Ichthyophthirius multifiliis]|uniref:Secretory granule protein t4-b, putative n=1 Tax=Ichthyophthirius multifiliis TaxID=5932 RepID=G0R2G8_ICHMU|nr:secretory granule protein t4-b, putative [Ichthyophthirius multifiliis]EGR28336.1 secretory granule protein t4-b, putative [Ichthyophthirius multifiliis]|eukprot:XP_004027681.1 secretory granule protein t4-b, putative [Ichthyophthirius multifiliis]